MFDPWNNVLRRMADSQDYYFANIIRSLIQFAKRTRTCGPIDFLACEHTFIVGWALQQTTVESISGTIQYLKSHPGLRFRPMYINMVCQCLATDKRPEIQQLVGALERESGEIGSWMAFAHVLAGVHHNHAFRPGFLRMMTPEIVAVTKFDPKCLSDSVVIQCASILEIDIRSLLLRNAYVIRRCQMAEKTLWAAKGLETIIDSAISELKFAPFRAKSTSLPVLSQIAQLQSVSQPNLRSHVEAVLNDSILSVDATSAIDFLACKRFVDTGIFLFKLTKYDAKPIREVHRNLLDQSNSNDKAHVLFLRYCLFDSVAVPSDIFVRFLSKPNDLTYLAIALGKFPDSAVQEKIVSFPLKWSQLFCERFPLLVHPGSSMKEIRQVCMPLLEVGEFHSLRCNAQLERNSINKCQPPLMGDLIPLSTFVRVVDTSSIIPPLKDFVHERILRITFSIGSESPCFIRMNCLLNSGRFISYLIYSRDVAA
jgi:hypothetical protein